MVIRQVLVLFVLISSIAELGGTTRSNAEEYAWAIEIYACDALGAPQKYFPMNTRAYFNITIRNPTTTPTNAAVSLSVLDALEVPVGVSEFNVSVPAGASLCRVMGVFILDWAYIGAAMAQASLYVDGVVEGVGSTDLFIWRPVLISAQISYSKTIIGSGYDLGITTTVLNKGPQSELIRTFFYANTTLIHADTRIAESGISTAFAFKWKTEAGIMANYNIAILLEVVLAETYTLKDYFVGGAVHVGLPGDVNGDLMVNIVDLWLMASAFNSEVGDLSFVSNNDVDGNGSINMQDLYIAAKHFGQVEH